MEPYLGQTIYLDLPPLVNPSTGLPSDADSMPTAKVYEDGDDMPILVPIVAKRVGTTGEYYVPVACTAANGFEVDRSYNVKVTAVVASTPGVAKVGTFQVRGMVEAGITPAQALSLILAERIGVSATNVNTGVRTVKNHLGSATRVVGTGINGDRAGVTATPYAG